MKISMPESIRSAISPEITLLSTNVVEYQIRAQRAGRGRLVTVQAEAKN
jgi:hypothetical protein